MKREIVVRGKLSDPKHIELDEPVTELEGAVEVVVRATEPGAGPGAQKAKTLPAWVEAFDAWVLAHDRSVTLPSPESLRREAIYQERT